MVDSLYNGLWFIQRFMVYIMVYGEWFMVYTMVYGLWFMVYIMVSGLYNGLWLI